MFLIKSCCSFGAATRISAVPNGAWLLTVRTAHYERIMLSPSSFFLPHICINMSVWDQPGGVETRFAAQLKCFSFFFFSFFFIPSSGGAASHHPSSRNPKMGSTEVQILCHCAVQISLTVLHFCLNQYFYHSVYVLLF